MHCAFRPIRWIRSSAACGCLYGVGCSGTSRSLRVSASIYRRPHSVLRISRLELYTTDLVAYIRFGCALSCLPSHSASHHRTRTRHRQPIVPRRVRSSRLRPGAAAATKDYLRARHGARKTSKYRTSFTSTERPFGIIGGELPVNDLIPPHALVDSRGI